MKAFVQRTVSFLFRWRKTSVLLFLCFLTLSISCSLMKNSKQQYRIACPIEWSTIDLYSQGTQVTGFLSDLLQNIAEEEKIDIRLIFVREKDAGSLVDEKMCDGYLTALPKTFSLEKKYVFSKPLFISGYLMVVKKSSHCKKLEDCVDANVGVASATLNRVLPFLNPSWRIYTYDTIYAALEEVSNNRIDGVLMDSLDLQNIETGRFMNILRPIYPSLSPHEIRVVTLKTDQGTQLVQHIDKAILRLQEKGRFAEHLKYWGVTSLTPAALP